MSTPETNGRAPADRELAAADAAADEIGRAELGDLDDFDEDADDDDTATGLEVAFTPRQILGGFALLAALILLLRRRSRRRS
jgi:hypothetical protein